MIREITAQELQYYQAELNNERIQRIENQVISYLQSHTVRQLLNSFSETKNILDGIISGQREPIDTTDASGNRVHLDAETAVDHVADTILSTIIIVFRRDRDLVNQFNANMLSAYNSTVPSLTEVPEEELAPTPEEPIEDEFDDMFDDEEFDNEEFEDEEDTEDLEHLTDDYDEPENLPDREQRNKELDALVQTFIDSFKSIEDDGTDKVAGNFLKEADRDKGHPEYYEDIGRRHEWANKLSTKVDTRVGINVGEGVTVTRKGWKTNEN